MSRHQAGPFPAPANPPDRDPPNRDPEACLRRASEYLELGGLKEAARWTRLAADAIAEKKRGH